MDGLIIASGVLAAFAAIGHLVIGGKSFLVPMTSAQFDAVPKKVMHCVFHFITVDFFLSAGLLLLAGFGVGLKWDPSLAIFLVGAKFGGYAVVQVAMVLASGIPKGLAKIFQWVFFVGISVLALIGILV